MSALTMRSKPEGRVACIMRTLKRVEDDGISRYAPAPALNPWRYASYTYMST